MKDSRANFAHRSNRVAFCGHYYLRLLTLLILIMVILVPVADHTAQASYQRVAHTYFEMTYQIEPAITYDPETKTIEVRSPGSVVRLTDIASSLRNNSFLERVGTAEWLLKVNLKIYEQVRLELHGRASGGDVDWLKLRSEPSGYASIESSNGQISIRSTKITSWDPRAGAFDTAFNDGSGRAYIAAKNRRAIYTDNRMDVIDSEIAYLGFFEETAYGISWKVLYQPDKQDTGILGKGLTGTITGSKFHHNYHGVYVYGVGDMVVRNNEIYENYGYGFDAHTITQRTTVEDNFSHDNGLHGIIFAEQCTGNVIRRNVSINNRGHGIMLHESSDNNLIVDNTVTGNDDGIPLFESSNNTIARNTVRDNVTGVRLYGRAANSDNNTFEDNEISDSETYGVFMYDGVSGNTFRSNRILSSGDAGVYMKGVFNNLFTNNVIRNNEYGIRFDSADAAKFSEGNQVRNNVIENNRQFGVYSYAKPGANLVEGNRFSGNGLGDVSYPGARVGGGGSRTFQRFRLVFLVIIIIVAVTSGALVLLRKRQKRGT